MEMQIFQIYKEIKDVNMRRKFIGKINFTIFFTFWNFFVALQPSALEMGNDTQRNREEIKFKSDEIRCRIAPPPIQWQGKGGSHTGKMEGVI